MVFERQDLQRVRLADAADPLWELALGVQYTQASRLPGPLAGWRQEYDRRCARPDRRVIAVSLLRELIPPRGPFPDLLTPHGPVTDIDAGCASVVGTSREQVRADLATVFAGRPASTWVQSLGRGDQEVVRQLVRALRSAHELLVAPHWAEIREVVAADHAVRTRQLATRGVHGLLANIPGVVGWDGRVLRVRYPVARTVCLRGRGLLLQPSYFCLGSPVTLLDPGLPPVLVFQALGRHVRPAVAVSERLVALLGRTRAECLRVLLTPRSTTELADQLGTSVGTASKQATILRKTGLVTSDRRGPAVMHSTTSLGLALLVSDSIG
jgi:DNA-binding transcriptional ArsR family regulator